MKFKVGDIVLANSPESDSYGIHPGVYKITGLIDKSRWPFNREKIYAHENFQVFNLKQILVFKKKTLLQTFFGKDIPGVLQK